ncbi:MAG: flagellar filament capping protein FliD [Oscillospiraceae bacterium]|nr:flagellar filament capping protein FliD [Oscillospiraceae bacterium]
MAGSQMRLSGINSGFDTEAMIKQMLSAYQSKIDTQTKKLQTLQWKQEQYRDITSKITSFKNKYFDILKRDTYLMSPSTFKKLKTTITTKSGKESGLKVSTTSDAVVGSHTLKVNSLATAAVTKGGQVSAGRFKLDVDRALADATADENGKYNFSLDVKVGNVAKTIEFSGSSKDELLSSLNYELEDAFGTTSGGAAFISAELKNGEFQFKTTGNSMATVTERTGNFGMNKPATRVAIDPAAALTGKSSISVSVPNYYTGEAVTKNIEFDTVSSTYFDGRGSDAYIDKLFNDLKLEAYAKKSGANYDPNDEAIKKMLQDQMDSEARDGYAFKYSSLDAASDYNAKSLTSALNSAYQFEQGITFKIDGSSMIANYTGPNMRNKAAEFTMTSTCDATFGLKKGSASSYLDETMKLSDLGITGGTVMKKDYTLPSNFKLNISNAMDRADADENGNYNFSLDIGVGGTTKTVTFSGKDEDEIAASLNSELAKAFGGSGLKVEKNGSGDYAFKMENGDSLSVTQNVGKFGIAVLSDKIAFDPGDIEANDSGSHWITVSLDGRDDVNFQFSGLKTADDYTEGTTSFNNLKEAAYRKANGLSETDPIDGDALDAFAYTTADAARDYNEERILNRFNTHFASDGYTFEYADGALTAKNAAGEAVKFSVSSDDGKLGLDAPSISYTIPEKEVPFEGSGEGYSLTINGKEITVGANATVKDLINAVNKSDAGVTLSYSKLEGAFTLTANDKGTGGDLRVTDSPLAQLLKLTDSTMASHTDGTNAMITIDGVQVEHNDNVYEIDGMKLDFSDVDPTENDTITVNLAKDTDSVVDTIKSFVEDYNKMIDEIAEYTYTARPQDKNKNFYDPLTDEEKEDMSDKEIEKWEIAAKKGLLYHDSTVMMAMNRIRSALTTYVTLDDGSKFGLASMGIKTASYLTSSLTDVQLGKLEIDEDRLRKALEEKPEAVEKLFTDAENGVMAKTKTAIENAVRESATPEKSGSLVRKAGTEKGTTAKTNAIYKEMERIQKRMERLQTQYDKKEDYWWKVFTNLEKMQAQFDSQQNYISQFTANGGYLSQ